jgi:hypothetical protein
MQECRHRRVAGGRREGAMERPKLILMRKRRHCRGGRRGREAIEVTKLRHHSGGCGQLPKASKVPKASPPEGPLNMSPAPLHRQGSESSQYRGAATSSLLRLACP